MNKPKEFFFELKKYDFTNYAVANVDIWSKPVPNPIQSNPQFHVIEKSTFDALLTDAKRIIELSEQSDRGRDLPTLKAIEKFKRKWDK